MNRENKYFCLLNFYHMSEKPEKHIRKPDWLKIKLPKGDNYLKVKGILEEKGLHTICSSGKCPNMGECWNAGTATFMILGEICTRSCKFCATKTGKPLPVDVDEPEKIAQSIKHLNLKHIVLTSVDRDDLPDGGATIWAATVRKVKELNPGTTIETLVPDFGGNADQLQLVIDSAPEIISHNLETVRRLTPQIRSAAQYDRSLKVLRQIADSGLRAKSGIMVGLGEKEAEVLETMDDLRIVNCAIFTIGQYLQPTPSHLKVVEYVHPDVFEKYRVAGIEKGFIHMESKPLVRSSYHAEKHVVDRRKDAMPCVSANGDIQQDIAAIPRLKKMEKSNPISIRDVRHRVSTIDLGLMPYQQAWDYQEKLLNEIITQKLNFQKLPVNHEQLTNNYLLFVEHPHVFTLGKSGSEDNMLANFIQLQAKNAEFIHTNRGGDITYHGPGQIVGYPILNLDYFTKGIRNYIEKLEEAIILCLQHYGLDGHRLEGATGVWLDPNVPRKTRKICAIGVRVSRGVSMHGFAFNVNTDLSYFSLINPCGFTDKKVTSLQAEMDKEIDINEVKFILKMKLAEVFNMELSI
jgi:lipoic acid synthetase